MTMPSGVPVAYDDLSGVWDTAEPLLLAGLPLQSVRVALPSSGEPATIPAVRIDLSRALRGQEPFVQLLLFSCQDSASYEAEMRPQIVQWKSRQIDLSNEYMILLVQQSGESGSTAHDDLLAAVLRDFPGDRTTSVGPAGTTEFPQMLKAIVEREFLRRCRHYEDELASLDGRQSTTAKFYGGFFEVKDRLACMYESMGLPNEALRQYNDVLNVEARLTKDSNALPPSGRILAVDPVSIREAVANEDMSLEELKLYLFARKASLLFILNKPSEALRSGLQLVRRTLERCNDDPHAKSWACEACWNLITVFRKDYSSAVEQESHPDTSSARIHHEEVRRASTQMCYMLRFLSTRLLEVAAGREALVSAHVWRTRDRDSLEHASLWSTHLPDVRTLGTFKIGAEAQAQSVFSDADLGDDADWLPSSLSSAHNFDVCYTRVLQLLVGYCQIAGRSRFSHLALKELIDVIWDRGHFHRALAALTAAPEFPLEWKALRRQLIYVALCYRQLGDLKLYYRTSMSLTDSHCGAKNDDAIFERVLKDIHVDLGILLAQAQDSGSTNSGLEFKALHSLRLEKASLRARTGEHDAFVHGAAPLRVGEAFSFRIDMASHFDGAPMQINKIVLRFTRLRLGVSDDPEPEDLSGGIVQGHGCMECSCSGSWLISGCAPQTFSGQAEMVLPGGVFFLSEVVFSWSVASIVVPWSRTDCQVQVREPTEKAFTLDLCCPRQVPPSSAVSVVCWLENLTSVGSECSLNLDVSTGATIKTTALMKTRETSSAAWHSEQVEANSEMSFAMQLNGNETRCIVVSLVTPSEPGSDATVSARLLNSAGTFLQTMRIKCQAALEGSSKSILVGTDKTNDGRGDNYEYHLVAFELRRINGDAPMHSIGTDVVLVDYKLDVPANVIIEADPNTHLRGATLKSIALAFRVKYDPSSAAIHGALLSMKLCADLPFESATNGRTVPSDLRPHSSVVWTQTIAVQSQRRWDILPSRGEEEGTTKPSRGEEEDLVWEIGVRRRVTYDIRSRAPSSEMQQKFRVILGPSWMTTTLVAGTVRLKPLSDTGVGLLTGTLSCVFMPLHAGKISLPEVQLYERKIDEYTVRPRGAYGEDALVSVLPTEHISSVALGGRVR